MCGRSDDPSMFDEPTLSELQDLADKIAYEMLWEKAQDPNFIVDDFDEAFVKCAQRYSEKSSQPWPPNPNHEQVIKIEVFHWPLPTIFFDS